MNLSDDSGFNHPRHISLYYFVGNHKTLTFLQIQHHRLIIPVVTSSDIGTKSQVPKTFAKC